MSQLPALPAAVTRRWHWLAVYFTGWTLLGLWQGINSALGHRGDIPPLPLWQPLTWELSSTLTVGVLALLVFRFEARFALSGGRTLRYLPLHAPAAVVFSLLHVALMVSLRKGVYALAGGHYVFGGAVPLFYEFQKDVITYAVIVGACVWLRTRR